MMKFRFCAAFALLLFSSHISFAQVTEALQNALESQPNSFHTIRIEFKENVDCYAMNHTFKQQNVPVSERPKQVIEALQHQAYISQKPVLDLIEEEITEHISNVHPFWIANCMMMQASAVAIEKLSAVSTVALIDLENSDIIAHDPIIREAEQSQRAPNGVEPGLVAINAPAMWQLGYTGRGTLVYDYDTGVWPTHPAFSERFLANRYPMSQCWTGFFSDEPNGNVSDHGTHVLGTMAGLVEETNDTIGVAFGAYWIANDFVTSTVEALPPLAAMMGAFEWALNPDGDINTTEDIPDVINNSWRWRDDPDTVQCAGLVVNLMNAIEAAGIANVFSGGNSGPQNTTVNAPQRINTSEVNTFSVGSVNGNVSFPYPISNFSTRGPSQCPSGGNMALEIHPEVVAPGQSVRSAWGTDEYNTISGTSMASPHVSGALLLLKEAFPYMSGEELLWALYETAVDLGEAGEDNVFGRGIIDVHAAFVHLSQSNTPVDPTMVAWDLEITGTQVPTDFAGLLCDDAITPVVSIENRGDSTITAIDFSFNVNGMNSGTYQWNGTLASGEATTVSLPEIALAESGTIDLNISAMILGQPEEYDLYNNRWREAFNRRTPQAIPFVDGFENGFDEKNWLISNPDGGITWDTVLAEGLNWSNYAASVQHYSYNPRDNQKDGLISELLEIPSTASEVWLTFDRAYQQWTSNIYSQDTFRIFVSTDCGNSFDEAYEKYSEELSSSDTADPDFIPEFYAHWAKDTVNLSTYAGNDILIQFQTTNRKGNNLYIDNVKVFEGDTEPASAPDMSKFVSIYPNPTNAIVFVKISDERIQLENLVVRNLMGQELDVPWQRNNTTNLLQTDHLKQGLYLIELQINGQRVVKRFTKL